MRQPGGGEALSRPRTESEDEGESASRRCSGMFWAIKRWQQRAGLSRGGSNTPPSAARLLQLSRRCKSPPLHLVLHPKPPRVENMPTLWVRNERVTVLNKQITLVHRRSSLLRPPMQNASFGAMLIEARVWSAGEK